MGRRGRVENDPAVLENDPVAARFGASGCDPAFASTKYPCSVSCASWPLRLPWMSAPLPDLTETASGGCYTIDSNSSMFKLRSKILDGLPAGPETLLFLDGRSDSLSEQRSLKSSENDAVRDASVICVG